MPIRRLADAEAGKNRLNFLGKLAIPCSPKAERTGMRGRFQLNDFSGLMERCERGAAPVNRALWPSLRGGAVLPRPAREFLAWRRSLCEGPLCLQLLPLRR
jgi:hypothetical protein